MTNRIDKYDNCTMPRYKRKSFISAFTISGIATALVLLGLTSPPVNFNKLVFAQQGQQGEQPNINASSLFNTRQ